VSPCDSLPPGFRAICEGTSGHTPAKRHAYLTLWLREGQIDRLPDGYAEPAETPKQSRGLGDTVRKITDATGISRAVKAVEKWTGRPCGCKGRQEKLNKAVPYKRPTDSSDPSP
jgi:hypothetical protein